jgi:hypothetical protein
MSRKKTQHQEKPPGMKNGFYIEVRNRTSTDRGIKLHSETRKAMEDNIRHYTRGSKVVVILGEYKDQKWLSKPVAAN